MELLRFFPLNRNIVGGQISSLIKTAVKYFVLFVLAVLVYGILSLLRLGLFAGIVEWIVQLYISMGMILSVFMFILQENKDAGGTR